MQREGRCPKHACLRAVSAGVALHLGTQRQRLKRNCQGNLAAVTCPSSTQRWGWRHLSSKLAHGATVTST